MSLTYCLNLGKLKKTLFFPPGCGPTWKEDPRDSQKEIKILSLSMVNLIDQNRFPVSLPLTDLPTQSLVAQPYETAGEGRGREHRAGKALSKCKPVPKENVPEGLN